MGTSGASTLTGVTCFTSPLKKGLTHVLGSCSINPNSLVQGFAELSDKERKESLNRKGDDAGLYSFYHQGNEIRIAYSLFPQHVPSDNGDDGFILGLSSNDPKNLQPSFTSDSILSNVYVIVPKDRFDEFDADYWTKITGKASFTKAHPLLGKFIIDGNEDAEYFLLRLPASMRLPKGTHPVKGALNESTLSALENGADAIAQWAEMISLFDTKVHQFIVDHEKDLKTILPKHKKRGSYYPKDIASFTPALVDDDDMNKFRAQLEALSTEVTTLLSGGDSAPPSTNTDVIGTVINAPKMPPAIGNLPSSSSQADDTTVTTTSTVMTVEQRRIASLSLMLGGYNPATGVLSPPKFHPAYLALMATSNKKERVLAWKQHKEEMDRKAAEAPLWWSSAFSMPTMTNAQE